MKERIMRLLEESEREGKEFLRIKPQLEKEIRAREERMIKHALKSAKAAREALIIFFQRAANKKTPSRKELQKIWGDDYNCMTSPLDWMDKECKMQQMTAMLSGKHETAGDWNQLKELVSMARMRISEFKTDVKYGRIFGPQSRVARDAENNAIRPSARLRKGLKDLMPKLTDSKKTENGT